jgi:hypothetical protein
MCALCAHAICILRFFIIFTPVLALTTGCTIAISAPKSSFGAVIEAENNGYEVSNAFNSSIIHIPGLTWSISGTYIPQKHSKPTSRSVQRSYRYLHTDKHPFQLKIEFPANCLPSEEAEDKLTTALNTTLNSVGGLPSKGRVSVQVTPNLSPVRRYVINGSFGRAFQLDYKTPCFTGQGNTSIWYAAMVALHESTHSSLKLAQGLPKGSSTREDLAIGAESCLLLSLNINNPRFRHSDIRLKNRISESIALQNQLYTISNLCKGWQSFIRYANRLQE